MQKAATYTHFILIDDSKMDLFLISKIIQVVQPDAQILSFDQPDLALAHFQSAQPEVSYLVLLDINMPVINGFDFLDAFHNLTESQKSKYSIYILTSSHNLTDIERGKSNPYVREVLHKPLSKDHFVKLLNL
ncbi:MAG: response regulator [Bacteroidia bacterium]|jgi:CheY-like chemotaxis protein